MTGRAVRQGRSRSWRAVEWGPAYWQVDGAASAGVLLHRDPSCGECAWGATLKVTVSFGGEGADVLPIISADPCSGVEHAQLDHVFRHVTSPMPTGAHGPLGITAPSGQLLPRSPTSGRLMGVERHLRTGTGPPDHLVAQFGPRFERCAQIRTQNGKRPRHGAPGRYVHSPLSALRPGDRAARS